MVYQLRAPWCFRSVGKLGNLVQLLCELRRLHPASQSRPVGATSWPWFALWRRQYHMAVFHSPVVWRERFGAMAIQIPPKNPHLNGEHWGATTSFPTIWKFITHGGCVTAEEIRFWHVLIKTTYSVWARHMCTKSTWAARCLEATLW